MTVLRVLALSSLSLVAPLASEAARNKEGSPGPPIASTGGFSHASGSSVVLEGGVDPRALPTTYYFQYGPTAAYGSQTTPASLPAGTVKVKVSQTVKGILVGYHYHLVATNADGTTNGHDRTLSLKRKATKKGGFVLPKAFPPTPRGGTFVLSGTLTGLGNANRSIVLQASPYPYRTAFADVGLPIATNAAGGFVFRVSNLFTSTRFRVVTVGTPALSSATVPERVTVRVVLKVRSSHAAGLVRLYGTVTPAEAGAHVFFQLEKTRGEEEGEGLKPGKVERPARTEKPGRGGKSEKSERPPAFLTRFSTVVRRATKTISRFSAVVKIRVAGRYRAFVEIPPGALVSGASQTILLHAAPGSATKGRHRKR